MKIIDVGRVCIIKQGNDFGKVVMIASIDAKSNIVGIEGLKFKNRKINMLHLWPLDQAVKSVEELKKVKL
ncbi:MAG: 50S ribosomal protein L14e [Candidatus Diapherotrites archaeon CG09_land_8_20_14_0_10_32_12]|nr:MAG: 50S ribosomal protein L14e [Candidatus Diapherotrites archaeon CG09_land_8_20_14_0_10_32_12]